MRRNRQPVQKRARLRTLDDTEGTPPGNGRVAGADARADPELSWDIVAQCSDESFPCSDPPAWTVVRVRESPRREVSHSSEDIPQSKAQRSR